MAASPSNKTTIEITSHRGRCLFAAEDIVEGDTIMSEHPIVSAQFLWNKMYGYTACDHCMRSLEPTRDLCARLLNRPDFNLPKPECCPRFQKALPLKCDECQAVYCSPQCKLTAFNEYHKTLCLSPNNPKSSQILNLQEIWKNMHFPPETASIMTLARIVAMIIQSSAPEQMFLDFSTFCNKSMTETKDIVHKFLGPKYIGNIYMLRISMAEIFNGFNLGNWFTEEGFNSLFALLATNAQGIGTSALSEWVNECNNLTLPDQIRVELDNFIENLYNELDEAAGQFLNAEGSGLYRKQSATNHSCSPNAESTFIRNDYTVVLKALHPIRKGEEICISYLSECQLQWSRYSRQKYLRNNYLFTCQCEKCISQADQPECTSSEEEDSEEDDTSCKDEDMEMN